MWRTWYLGRRSPETVQLAATTTITLPNDLEAPRLWTFENWHGLGLPGQMKEIEMDEKKFSNCIDICNECAEVCERCATACLKEEDASRMADCIRLDRDCADICRLAAALMARDSAYAKQICRLCADICEACGAECAKHDAGHCQACAECCRRCATACREMAA